MKRALIGIVITTIALLAGCTAWFSPSIDFTASTEKGPNPLAVQFTPVCDQPIAAYAWTFGDGEMSDDPSPMHIYRETGTYTVGLMAELVDGSVVHQAKPGLITVNAPMMKATLEYIYWIHVGTGAIWRGPVGGGQKEKVIKRAGLSALDVADGWIYWAESLNNGAIYRMRVDGSEQEKLLTGQYYVTDIHVVPETDTIFWVRSPDYYGYDEDARGGLYYAFLDQLEPYCIDSCAPRAERHPSYVAVDVLGERIYWALSHYSNDRVYEDEDVIRVTGTSGYTPTTFLTTHSPISQIELDTIPGFPAEHVYWFTHGYPTLHRNDVDGLHEHAVLQGNELTGWFTVDRMGGKIYFTSFDGIERCDLDGTQRELLYEQDAMMGIALPR